MSIFKLLTKKSTLLCVGLLLLFSFMIPVEAWAAVDTGPFSEFLKRAARLFMQTRNALFIIAVFVFVGVAWTLIKDGKAEWDKIFYLIVGLVILGVAGWVVSYMANPSDSEAVITQYQDLENTEGWD